MKAIVVVQGEPYQRMAELSVPRMEQVLKTKVHVYTLLDTVDLWEFKLTLLDLVRDEVLCLDADLVFCSFNWRNFNPSFNAVLDYNLPKWRHGANAIAQYYPPEYAINAGLWYAQYNTTNLKLFERARHHYHYTLKDFPYKMGDQAPLNLAIHELQPPMNILPNTYNWQVTNKDNVKLPKGTHIGHAIGQSFDFDGNKIDLDTKLKRLKMMLDFNPPDLTCDPFNRTPAEELDDLLDAIDPGSDPAQRTVFAEGLVKHSKEVNRILLRTGVR